MKIGAAMPYDFSFNRGGTVTKRFGLIRLGKASSEKQDPQIIENP
jgi:hypothetical protein